MWRDSEYHKSGKAHSGDIILHTYITLVLCGYYYWEYTLCKYTQQQKKEDEIYAGLKMRC